MEMMGAGPHFRRGVCIQRFEGRLCLCKDPARKRQYYIAAGLAAGRRAARIYRGRDLGALLCSDGVEIRRFSDPSPSGLHSQICCDGAAKQVDLFRDTAGQLSAAMDKTPCPVSPQELERLFLAHEFYHWLEYSSGAGTELQCEPICTKLFGLFSASGAHPPHGRDRGLCVLEGVLRPAGAPKGDRLRFAYGREGKSKEICPWRA